MRAAHDAPGLSLSAMQIGPDAFNLAGAGAGAARVVSAILTNR